MIEQLSPPPNRVSPPSNHESVEQLSPPPDIVSPPSDREKVKQASPPSDHDKVYVLYSIIFITWFTIFFQFSGTLSPFSWGKACDKITQRPKAPPVSFSSSTTCCLLYLPLFL